MFQKIIKIVLIILAIIIAYGYYRSFQDRRLAARQASLVTAKPEKTITIIEGKNLREIGSYLTEQGFIFSDSLLDLKAGDYQSKYIFLADTPAKASLEGYLFPDTYRVFASTTLNEIVTKMLDNFASKLNADLLTEIKKQKKTVLEIVTMASILEKEVKTEVDMKIVSGIFWKKVKNGEGLKSCATLAYILGVNKPQYSQEDTQIDSPYNTYKYRGLPPGPISNPSLKALKAAIYPTETDYNFFLSRPDTGETVFSVTYDEHVLNKNKYLK